MFGKTEVCAVSESSKTNEKGLQPLKTHFVYQKQTGRGRSEAKNARVKQFSSFIWTFMIAKENGKMIGRRKRLRVDGGANDASRCPVGPSTQLLLGPRAAK